MKKETESLGLETMTRDELLALYDKMDANRAFHAVLLARDLTEGRPLASKQVQSRLANFADADRVMEIVSDENSRRILSGDVYEEAA